MPSDNPPRLAITIAARLDDVALAGVALHAVFRHLGLSKRDADGFELAMVEALNNVIAHGYQHDESQQLRVQLHVETQRIVCDIVDHGGTLPADVLARLRREAVQLPHPSALAESGYGLALMQVHSDDLKYNSSDGANIMRLVKNRSKNDQ